MDLKCSPCPSPGGSIHMLSPTHPSVDGFTTIHQIRRSLSRSPSKTSRYTLLTTRCSATGPSVPMSPVPKSPSGLSRTFSADSQYEFKLKTVGNRAGPVRTRSRRTSPNSPLRRALSDNTNQVNLTTRYPSRANLVEPEQENMDCSEDGAKFAPTPRFDGPIKIEFGRPGPEKILQPVMRDHASPMKSSPLKRSDGVMNLEAATFGSPRGSKRRSLHGASLAPDFSIFDQGCDGTQDDPADANEERDGEKDNGQAFSWSSTPAHSPPRRPFSLRRSTLQQRAGPVRKNLFADSMRDSVMSPSISRSRPRISLDGALPLRSPNFDSSHRGNVNDTPVLFGPSVQKAHQFAPKPHPLSQALTPSSSASSVVAEESREDECSKTEKQCDAALFQKPVERLKPPSGFSKSLPIGSARPGLGDDTDDNATPTAFKMAKPLPQAFMSTGLISKRHRNVDDPGASLFSSSHMPDTPSKKAPLIHIGSTPAPSALGKVSRPLHEFGSPSTPFSGRVSAMSPESLGNTVNTFGARVVQPQLTRRSSFLSIDGEESSSSPTENLDSQVSNDDLPPTPTKSTSTSTRSLSKGKSNSLRSSLLGRRKSLAPDTFASPADREHPVAVSDQTSPSNAALLDDAEGKLSSQLPFESFTPPDPSRLSISAERRGSSLFGSNSFPPATPTGPRIEHFSLGQGHANASSGYFANDVDTALTARFGKVASFGIGEFSQVYKVEQPLNSGLVAQLHNHSSPGGNVWAVKKSRRPYVGVKDRQRKMQEVHILKALRGNEHIIELVDEWESKNHLYIQTEYCDNGNLKDFLSQTGFKGRLDDFRIWKILLELAQGVKSIHDANFIHLDLKPANVFIDWEGLLKIGDFGMASSWPAPSGIDGEGDREYIGPEVLSGRFDKPADIFSLGMIMLEIAGNIVLPDNGASWQRLRAGDLSDLPSLTWSSDSSLVRDESGDPIELLDGQSSGSLCTSQREDDDLSFLRSTAPRSERVHDLVTPPKFMIEQADPESLDRMVQWLVRPDPDERPCVDQVLAAGSVQWVQRRRRAGATVYEGNWGPADDVLHDGHDLDDVEMTGI